MTKGQIYKIHSDFYYVTSGVENFECKVREVLKKQKEKILVGDFVEFHNGHIEKIYPRKNYIARPSVANIDQIIVVSALKQPYLNLLQLNRYIALAKYYNIPTVLCFNKEDLECEEDLITRIIEIYKPLGFKIVFTSATEHQGITAFQDLLEGNISVLCGNSGVGKSSLINAINPSLKLRTKAVSDKLMHGTHTTRHCEIIKINETSSIVDTPGFSNVKFDFLMPADVDLLFEEFIPLRNGCKYSDCLHINEDGCNVLDHFADIDDTRYESYLEFVQEAKTYKEKVKYEGRKVENNKKYINNKFVAKISERKRLSARNNLKQRVYKEIDNEEE